MENMDGGGEVIGSSGEEKAPTIFRITTVSIIFCDSGRALANSDFFKVGVVKVFIGNPVKCSVAVVLNIDSRTAPFD